LAIVKLTTATILPERAKIIRDQIKKILSEEPQIKEAGVKKFHNTATSARSRAKPYIYVMWINRIVNDDNSDSANFEYEYQFQVGIVTQLRTFDEDKMEDYGLNLLNLCESALSINPGLDNITAKFLYSHDAEKDLSNTFDSSIIHMFFRVGYTADVPLGA